MKLADLVRLVESEIPSEEIYPMVKDLPTETFVKKCTGFITADKLSPAELAKVGTFDGVTDGSVEAIMKYIGSNNSEGVLAVQDGGKDVYAPSAKALAKYKDACSGDPALKKMFPSIQFKSQGNAKTSMVDLKKASKEVQDMINKNGIKKSWGTQHTSGHKYGTYIVIEGTDIYLCGKDASGLPENYQKA